MAAVTPLDFMPSDLNTASLPTQRAANGEGGDGCERQCVISALVKWRLTNVGLCEGTEEISLGDLSERGEAFLLRFAEVLPCSCTEMGFRGRPRLG